MINLCDSDLRSVYHFERFQRMNEKAVPAIFKKQNVKII